MSRNEKGYFKKYVSSFSSGEGNYAKLFDAIDAQEIYDEKKIVADFKKEKFVKQLSVTKNYLFDFVLRSIRAFHAAKNVSEQIHTYTENADILFSRSLIDEAFSSLDKARQLTHEYDLLTSRIEIDRLERSFHLELACADWKEKLEVSYTDTDKDMQTLILLQQIHKVYYQMLHFWRHERLIRTKDQEDYVEQLISLKALHTDASQYSFNTHQTILTIWMIYYFLKNENEKSYAAMKKVLDLWQLNTQMAARNPIRYIAALNNYFSTCVKTNRFDELEECIKNLDTSFLDGNETSAAVLFENMTTYRMMILHNRNDNCALIEFVKTAEPEMRKHEKRINKVRLLIFKYNCLMLYFICGMYSDALDRLNEILLIKDIELRRDIQAAARIINLILHYELGNATLLTHAAKSSRRYLESRDKLFEMERIFFRHFLKLSLKADNTGRQKVYAAMKNEVENLCESIPLEKNFLQTFDLLLWLKSKQKNMTQADYLSLKK